MGAFIFLCDFSTEQECLERKLFGTNPGEMHQHHYSKIAFGDTLFLYNFETGQMRGPFNGSDRVQAEHRPHRLEENAAKFPLAGACR